MTMHYSRRLVGLLAIVAGLNACTERPTPLAPTVRSDAGMSLQSTPSVTWHAPLGTATADPATFDAGAAPVVEICAWTAGACAGPVIARFATVPGADTQPLTVNTTIGQFEGNWSLLSTSFTVRKTYRIRVLQEVSEIGALSVDVVRGRWALTRADGTLAPLSSANTLPIRFGITSLNSATALIGPGGGTVTAPDGRLSLIIPSGALGLTIPITITETTGQTSPSILPGTRLGNSWRLSPSGTKFARPVRVVLGYDNTPSAVAAGLNLGAIHWNDRGTLAEAVTTTNDLQNKILSFTVSEFSLFVMVQHPAPTDEGWTTLDATWKIPHLKWYLRPSPATTWLNGALVKQAMDEWQGVSGITLTEATRESDAQIVITHDPAPDCPFWVASQTLGVTCFSFLAGTPVNNDLGKHSSTIVKVIATHNVDPSHFYRTLRHEIGHALGLGHPARMFTLELCDVAPADATLDCPIMAQGAFSRTGLHPWDIQAIQYLYPPAPTLAVSASAVQFTATAGGNSPAAQSIQITNGGTATLAGLSASVGYQNGQPNGWLAASLNSTTAPATLSITPNIGSLAAGNYNATITIASNAIGVTNSPQQVAVAMTVTSNGQAQILASGLGGIFGISRNGSTLAFSDYYAGGIYKVLTDGSSLVKLATVPNTGPTGIVNDGTDIYWLQVDALSSNPGIVRKVPIGGGPATTVVNGLVGAGANLQSDGTNLYFYSFTTHSIKKVSKAGGTPVDIVQASPEQQPAFTISGGNVFFLDAQKIKRVSTAGGAVTTLTSGATSALDLLVVGTTLYWVNPYSPGCCALGLFSVPTSAVSVAPTTRVSGPAMSNLASDGTSLYVSGPGVLRYNLSNFSNVTTISTLGGSTGFGFSLVVDGQSVFWHGSGQLLKAQK